MPMTTRPVASPAPLSRAAVGEPRLIVAISDAAREELGHEGLMPGSVVVVRNRTPLGGPLVVELGRTRLALSMDVAGCVSTLAESR